MTKFVPCMDFGVIKNQVQVQIARPMPPDMTNASPNILKSFMRP